MLKFNQFLNRNNELKNFSQLRKRLTGLTFPSMNDLITNTSVFENWTIDFIFSYRIRTNWHRKIVLKRLCWKYTINVAIFIILWVPYKYE